MTFAIIGAIIALILLVTILRRVKRWFRRFNDKFLE